MGKGKILTNTGTLFLADDFDFVQMTKEEHEELKKMNSALKQNDNDIETFDSANWRRYGQLEMKFNLAAEMGSIDLFEETGLLYKLARGWQHLHDRLLIVEKQLEAARMRD